MKFAIAWLTFAIFFLVSCGPGPGLIPPPSPVSAIPKIDADSPKCKFLGVSSGTFPYAYRFGTEKEKENYAVFNTKVAAERDFKANSIHVVSVNRNFDVRGKIHFLIVAKAYRCAQQ
ncbi:MAG: hypothetical protein IIA14_03825 [SAR324 cluster bacterium]|nr:hypothetical protein [SAR324 cluster bacterium]